MPSGLVAFRALMVVVSYSRTSNAIGPKPTVPRTTVRSRIASITSEMLIAVAAHDRGALTAARGRDPPCATAAPIQAE